MVVGTRSRGHGGLWFAEHGSASQVIGLEMTDLYLFGATSRQVEMARVAHAPNGEK